MIFATQRKRGHHAFIVLMVALLALMPTYSALAEIQATPVVEPTPTEAVVEEALVEEMPPVATPGAEPDARPVGMNSPMSIIPGPSSSSLKSCTQDPIGKATIM